MGLEISAGNKAFRAGSYTGFHNFRNWLAQKIGFKNIENYYDTYKDIIGEFNHKTGICAGASRIPLGPLLEHSDCDGTINNKQAVKLLSELKEIKQNLKKLPRKDKKGARENEIWFRERLDNWVEACQEAIEHEDPIYFG
mgnify:FL=1